MYIGRERLKVIWTHGEDGTEEANKNDMTSERVLGKNKRKTTRNMERSGNTGFPERRKSK